MKRKITITVILLFLANLCLFAEKVIGVTEFNNLSKRKSLSWLKVGIADSISYKLRNIKEYIVIDRTNVDRVMHEIALGGSGMIDEKSAKKAGKALNADLLVVGNFQVYGKKVRITAKIVDVETHKIMKQVQSTGTMDNIFEIQDNIALNIIRESDIEITGDLKKRITQKYTTNISAYEYFSKGQKYYYQTKYTDAIKMFRKASKIDSGYSLAYAGLGKAYANHYWHQKNYANKKKPELLEDSYLYSRKALSINKNLDEAHLSLAKYYQNADINRIPNKWKKCEEETKKTLELNPNNGEAWFLMSRIYGYDNEKEEMYLNRALSKNNFLADAHNNLGIIYTEQKKYLLAIESFKKAIEIDPDYVTPYMNIGVVYDSQKLYNKALNQYRIIVKKYPNYLLGLLNLGIGYRRLKQYDEALKYFKKAVKIKPDYADGLGEIGYIYLSEKKYLKAIGYYKKSLKYSPNSKYSLSNIAFCYRETGDYSNAVKYSKQAAQKHPTYAWPAGELGWLYTYKLKNREQGIKWYREAAKRDPQNSRYRSNLEKLLKGK